MEILLATASHTDGRTARNLLHRAGFDTVTECYEVETTLAHLRREEWDLLVTEKHLQDGSGHVLARRVRARPGERGTPILMIGGQYTHEEVLQATRSGVDGFLIFPCPPSRLKQKVEDLTQDTSGEDEAVIHRL